MKKLFFIFFIFLDILLGAQKLNLVKDTANNPTQYKYQKWNQEAWQDSLIYNYSYFTDSLVIVKKSLNTQNNSIETDGKLTQIKNENNQIVKELWQTDNNGWVNSYEYLYSYQDNKVVSALYQEWINEVWTPIYQAFYQYDDNNNCTTELWKKWQNDILVNSHIFNYTYDANNNLIRVLYSYWNDADSLIDSYRKSFVYSDTLVTEYKYEKFQDNLWQNVYKYTYQYDSDAHFVRTDYYNWQNNQWENTLFAQYNYIGDNLTEEVWLYNYQGYDYFYARNIFTYQNSFFDNDVVASNGVQLRNYPNPFNPTTTIVANGISDYKNATIKIYDIKGRLINLLKFEGKQSIIWNGKNSKEEHCPSGVYFLKLDVDKNRKAILKTTLLK